ncbi:unnamed protein product [Musa hybrid cultivar]
MINISSTQFSMLCCLSISSSYGQTLTTSAFVGETLFSILIILVGLVLFVSLAKEEQYSIAKDRSRRNIQPPQKYANLVAYALSVAEETIIVVGKRCSDINQLKMWMCHRLLLLLRPLEMQI